MQAQDNPGTLIAYHTPDVTERLPPWPCDPGIAHNDVRCSFQ